jgi:hypothetical protein
MPTLNWIGKEAVVKHHKEVPFRLLEPVSDLSCGDTASGNLIVGADPNLSHRTDPILSQGRRPAFRSLAVDKCRS